MANFHGGHEVKTVLDLTESDGKVHSYGLIRNDYQIIFDEEVLSMTDDHHSFHLVWSPSGVYVIDISGGHFLLPVPVGAKTYEVFALTVDDFAAEGLQGWLPSFSRGLRYRDTRNQTHTLWISSTNDLLYSVEEKRLHPKMEFERPHPVSIADFKAWHSSAPIHYDQNLSVYQIWALFPDQREGKGNLVFDLSEIRFEDGKHSVYQESRATGFADAQKLMQIAWNHPGIYLSEVYHTFGQQKNRNAFNENLMSTIKIEDQKLGLDRLIYLTTTGYENSDAAGRTLGGIRLFQGYSHPAFQSKDMRTPVERKYDWLNVRKKFKDKKLFEFNRLFVNREEAPWLNTKKLVKMMLQYLDTWNIQDGVFIIHTDEEGSELYRRFFGAKPEWGPEETRDGTYILSVEQKTLEEKVHSINTEGLTEKSFLAPLSWCNRALRK